MIEWYGSYFGFYRYAEYTQGNISKNPRLAIHTAVLQFANYYECEFVIEGASILFKCSEENLLMIKLQCPGAIDYVVA